MGSNSNIEWTGDTWNPLVSYNESTGKRGWFCVHVSEGCRNCYAEAMNTNLYFGNGLKYRTQDLDRQRLALSTKGQSAIGWPIRAREPRRIFVCSMTDLFGEWVPDTMIDAVFAAIALAPQHTFQILTKRAARTRAYFSDLETRMDEIGQQAYDLFGKLLSGDATTGDFVQLDLPLANAWLGVSVEDQATADCRIPELIGTPAAIRWISAEPLLGPIDLERNHPHQVKHGGYRPLIDDLDWVVAGYESGTHARPRPPAFARSLRDQCLHRGKAFLFKQWGEYLPQVKCSGCTCVEGDRCVIDPRATVVENNEKLVRVGKKSAGRSLDGQIWNGYPEQ